jgi:hypothetical protein
MLLAKAGSGIRFNDHIEGDGPTVFAHACKMGLKSWRNGRTRPTAPTGRPTGSR